MWRGGGEGEDEVGGEEEEGRQGEKNARGKIFCSSREEPLALAALEALMVLLTRLIGALRGTWRVFVFGPRRRAQQLLCSQR